MISKWFDSMIEKLADRIAQRVQSRTFEISSIGINPGDVLVLRAERQVSDEEAALITKELKKTFPNNRALILESGLDLGVLSHDLVVQYERK